MCGRYYIDQEDDIAEMRKILDVISQRFRDAARQTVLQTGEIRPTNQVPVLRVETVEETADQSPLIRPDLMTWGFQHPANTRVVINARSETASEKPMFRQSFQTARVLVPATAFFEWDKQSPPVQGKRQKYKITVPEQPLFYMAGLSRYEVSTSAWHFVILTTPASASLAVLHDRQPLILPRNWLRSWMHSPGAARKMLDYIWHEPFTLSAEA